MPMTIATPLRYFCAMALFACTACATSMEVSYRPLVSGTIPPRREPARVVVMGEEELIAKGYVKIGSITVKKTLSECYDEPRRPCGMPALPGKASSDTSLELRRRAAERGGAVVVMEKSDELYWDTLLKKGDCVRYYEKDVVIRGQQNGRYTESRVGTYRKCLEYAMIHGKGVFERSMGSVWGSGESAGESELAAAVRKNDIPRAKALLAAAGNIDLVRDIDKEPLLMRAVKNRSREMVRLLLERGASPNVKSEKGVPLVSYIALSRDEKNKKNPVVMRDASLLRLFIQKGADVNAPASGRVALHFAAKYGDADYVRVLLAAGAAKSVNAGDAEGYTPLMLALKYCDDAKSLVPVVKMLVGGGASLDVKNCSDETPLHLAARPECLEAMRIILAGGSAATINARNKFSMTPLMVALSRKVFNNPAMLRSQVELVRLLAENGADVNGTCSYYKTTPLHTAVDNENVEAVRVLLSRGAEKSVDSMMDHHNRRRWVTPLMIACYYKPNAAIAGLLVQKGADVSRVDINGVRQMRDEAVRMKYKHPSPGSYEAIIRFLESRRR